LCICHLQIKTFIFEHKMAVFSNKLTEEEAYYFLYDKTNVFFLNDISKSIKPLLLIMF